MRCRTPSGGSRPGRGLPPMRATGRSATAPESPSSPACCATAAAGGVLQKLSPRSFRCHVVRQAGTPGEGSERQGHRAAEPARLRPEPDLVPDRRPGLRPARLHRDARPHRPGPAMGTKPVPPMDLLRRRPDRLRQPPPPPAPARRLALDTRHHRRHRLAAGPWHSADQTASSRQPERRNTRAPWYPAHTARKPGQPPRPAAETASKPPAYDASPRSRQIEVNRRAATRNPVLLSGKR